MQNGGERSGRHSQKVSSLLNFLRKTTIELTSENFHQSDNCGFTAQDACCVCGGGVKNRPLLASGDCSLSLQVHQLTPAERMRAQMQLPANNLARYPYNPRSTERVCSAQVTLQHAGIDIVNAMWLARDERHQLVRFACASLCACVSVILSHRKVCFLEQVFFFKAPYIYPTVSTLFRFSPTM